MKFFFQHKNTFIRTFDEFGYILNQKSGKEFRFNSIGAVFLTQIEREIKRIDDSVNEMLNILVDVDFVTLNTDFKEFLIFLEIYGLVVLGNSKREIIEKSRSIEDCPTSSNNNDQNKSVEFEEVSSEESDSNVFKFDPISFNMHVELTNKCNERCMHCYIPSDERLKGNFLEFNIIKKVLDEISFLKLLNVTFSGGEILLHPQLDEILKYSRKKDFIITLFSNLINLQDIHIELFKEINPKIIQVTLYSIFEKEHDFITKVKGSCLKTKKSIDKLIANKIQVGIACPILKYNYKSYIDIVRYAHEKNIKLTTDYEIIAQSNFNKRNLDTSLNLSEFESHLKDVLYVNQEYGTSSMKDKIDSVKVKNVESSLCGAGFDRLTLTSQGNYIPCPAWKKFKTGNAKEFQFKDIIYNSENIKYLRSIKKSAFTKCINCDVFDYCNICMERNYNESNGDIFKINEEYCKFVVSYKRILFNNK